MSLLQIIEPMPIAAVATSRGSGGMNLATRDPKEVWADTASGSAAQIILDLGRVRAIDTVALIAVRSPAPEASWSITAGIANGAEFNVQGASTLRVPDVVDDFAETSHALWTGGTFSARYLTIAVSQPGSAAPLSIGVVVIGRAFVANLGQEWGSGRKPIDTGSATALAGGGFSIVEGVRKLSYSWTFGDLTQAEAERLETISLNVGETLPGLVIEDAARTAGLRRRMHYGKFDRWRAYERRNKVQTRWEIGIEDWV